jgi:hypothetical protein
MTMKISDSKYKFNALILVLLLPSSVLGIDPGDFEDPTFFYYDYTARDHEVVDYQMYTIPGVDIWKFRGPKPDLEKNNYFVALGASQTLGVLIDKPYPALLAEELGMEALNLALGGGTASAYADEDVLIELINKGKFLILQVMRAATESTSRFTPTKHLGLVRETKTGEVVEMIQAWDDLLIEEPERVALYVAQARNSWTKGYHDLLGKVEVPVILLWFSPREIDSQPNYHLAAEGQFLLFMDAFPTLIDRTALDSVRSLCDFSEVCAAYVEVRGSRAREFDFINRFTGEPVEIDYAKLGLGNMKIKKSRNTDTGYWSQEMHEDAVGPLLEAIGRLEY